MLIVQLNVKNVKAIHNRFIKILALLLQSNINSLKRILLTVSNS